MVGCLKQVKMELFKELIYIWQEEIAELFEWPGGTYSEVTEFIDFYPFVLSLMWSYFALVGLARSLKRRPEERDLPTYSVLIPFYLEIESAIESAWSLQKVSPAPDEIILIDDGTPAKGQRSVKELPPRARIIRLPKNKGKAGALNAALSSCQSEVIVCMDADTRAVSTGLDVTFEKGIFGDENNLHTFKAGLSYHKEFEKSTFSQKAGYSQRTLDRFSDYYWSPEDYQEIFISPELSIVVDPFRIWLNASAVKVLKEQFTASADEGGNWGFSGELSLGFKLGPGDLYLTGRYWDGLAKQGNDAYSGTGVQASYEVPLSK